MKKSIISTCQNCISKNKGIFCGLGTPETEDLSRHKIINTFKKGQTIFMQGNHPSGIYCIGNGNIKLTQIGNDGKETILKIAQGGDILGHQNIFTEDSCSATATAMKDTEICFIDKKYILKVIENNPNVAMNIIHKLSRDMSSAENKLSSLHQKNVRERLAELILSLKKSHGVMDGGSWKIDLKLTREEMAKMIGTSHETLIRFMTEFKEAGMLEQVGKIIFIKNELELKDTANMKY
ncbi:MAG: Crp/Fnr family transcriptional regulator [Bacteriovorax sp.]|nr:Crp/Fnr family transcriptional regulator [Bacteriovorax sp.]